MEIGEKLSVEEYSEKLDQLKGWFFSTRVTVEERNEAESQMLGLVSGRLKEIIEDDRSNLPGFLETIRKLLTVGHQNASMNGDYYGEFLEKALVRAFLPDMNEDIS